MSIMLEAHGYHNIEKNERKQKYEDTYEKEMKAKVNKWQSISDRNKENKNITLNEIEFLIKESKLLFEEKYSRDIPYLKDHLKKVKADASFRETYQAFMKVLPDYKKFVQHTRSVLPKLFNNGSLYWGMVDKAKFLIKKHEDTNIILNKIMGTSFEEYDLLDEYHQNKKILENIETELYVNKKLEPESLNKLIRIAEISIVEYMDTADIFFAHHFSRVRRYEKIEEDIKTLRVLFNRFYPFIYDIANGTHYHYGYKDKIIEYSGKARNMINDIHKFYISFSVMENEERRRQKEEQEEQ